MGILYIENGHSLVENGHSLKREKAAWRNEASQVASKAKNQSSIICYSKRFFVPLQSNN